MGTRVRRAVTAAVALLAVGSLAGRATGGRGVFTPASAEEPREVVVSAASSLVDVLATLGAAYERETGERIAVNTGPSNTLARQILAGAPVDVFISADQAQMDVASPALAAGTRVNIVRNQLAIAVRADATTTVASVRDLAGPSFRRIAIGDPAAVPVGVYARALLERVGVWSVLQPRLVPTATARLALAAVESGAVSAAVVFRTDILASTRARAAYVVPVADGPAILYPAAAIRRSRNLAGAQRFLAFLRSAPALAVFERSGFLPATS